MGCGCLNTKWVVVLIRELSQIRRANETRRIWSSCSEIKKFKKLDTDYRFRIDIFNKYVMHTEGIINFLVWLDKYEVGSAIKQFQSKGKLISFL